MSIISFSKHLETRYPYDEQLFSPSIIVVEMLYTPTYRLAYHLAYITFVNLKRKRNIFALHISFWFFFCLATFNTFYVVQFLGPGLQVGLFYSNCLEHSKQLLQKSWTWGVHGIISIKLALGILSRQGIFLYMSLFSHLSRLNETCFKL